MKPQWNIGSVLRFSFAGLLLGTFILPNLLGAAASQKQYAVRCDITHTNNGKTVTLASPRLCVVNGQQGSFLAGGVMKAGDDTSAEEINFGRELNATVTDAGDGKVRLSARLANSWPMKHDGAGVIVCESSVRILQTVKLDEAIDLKMDDGTAVHLVVSEVKPGLAK